MQGHENEAATAVIRSLYSTEVPTVLTITRISLIVSMFRGPPGPNTCKTDGIVISWCSLKHIAPVVAMYAKSIKATSLGSWPSILGIFHLSPLKAGSLKAAKCTCNWLRSSTKPFIWSWVFFARCSPCRNKKECVLRVPIQQWNAPCSLQSVLWTVWHRILLRHGASELSFSLLASLFASIASCFLLFLPPLRVLSACLQDCWNVMLAYSWCPSQTPGLSFYTLNGQAKVSNTILQFDMRWWFCEVQYTFYIHKAALLLLWSLEI